MDRSYKVYICTSIVSITPGIDVLKNNKIVGCAHKIKGASMPIYKEFEDGSFAQYYQPFGSPEVLAVDIAALKQSARPSSFEKLGDVPIIEENTGKVIRIIQDADVIAILTAVRRIQAESPMYKERRDV
jgi:hypothetical protein